MIEAGIDIAAVREIPGHADIRMTARYAHATSEAKRRAVEKLAEFGAAGDAPATNEKQPTKRPAVSG